MCLLLTTTWLVDVVHLFSDVRQHWHCFAAEATFLPQRPYFWMLVDGFPVTPGIICKPPFALRCEDIVHSCCLTVTILDRTCRLFSCMLSHSFVGHFRNTVCMRVCCSVRLFVLQSYIIPSTYFGLVPFIACLVVPCCGADEYWSSIICRFSLCLFSAFHAESAWVCDVLVWSDDCAIYSG